MRALTLAAIAGIGMTLAGAAAARPWNDPAGRVTFDAPSGWVTEVQRDNPQTIVLTGNANNECYVVTAANPGTAEATPDRIMALADPLPAAEWTRTANSIAPMFPHASAQLTGQSVDTSGAWPIQRAQFTAPDRPVLAALTRRPGFDLIAMCWTYDGPDATARYEALFRSLGNSNDATWQAAAAERASERAAAAAAQAQQAQAAPPQPPAQQEAAHGRHGHDSRQGPTLTAPH